MSTKVIFNPAVPGTSLSVPSFSLVLTHDMERFYRFHEAVDLVTSTSRDVKVQHGSCKLGNVLFPLTGLMRSVVSCNASVWSLNKGQGCV